jgi:hypothetical protein
MMGDHVEDLPRGEGLRSLKSVDIFTRRSKVEVVEEIDFFEGGYRYAEEEIASLHGGESDIQSFNEDSDSADEFVFRIRTPRVSGSRDSQTFRRQGGTPVNKGTRLQIIEWMEFPGNMKQIRECGEGSILSRFTGLATIMKCEPRLARRRYLSYIANYEKASKVTFDFLTLLLYRLPYIVKIGMLSGQFVLTSIVWII